MNTQQRGFSPRIDSAIICCSIHTDSHSARFLSVSRSAGECGIHERDYIQGFVNLVKTTEATGGNVVCAGSNTRYLLRGNLHVILPFNLSLFWVYVGNT